MGGDALGRGFSLIFCGGKGLLKIYHHEQIVWAILLHIRDDLSDYAPLVTWEPGPEVEEMDAGASRLWVWILTQQLLSDQVSLNKVSLYLKCPCL